MQALHIEHSIFGDPELRSLASQWSGSLADAADKLRDRLNRERSLALASEGEDSGRIQKSASGTAKYTLHQRCIAHALGFGPDHLAPRLMSTFWKSEWPQRWEQAYRALLKLRYQLAGRLDADETSIWAKIFGETGGLGVGYLHVRTCYFDAYIEENAASHKQLVILGAGFDSRCYRLQRLPARWCTRHPVRRTLPTRAVPAFSGQ